LWEEVSPVQIVGSVLVYWCMHITRGRS
jgi:hypothetical protein